MLHYRKSRDKTIHHIVKCQMDEVLIQYVGSLLSLMRIFDSLMKYAEGKRGKNGEDVSKQISRRCSR